VSIQRKGGGTSTAPIKEEKPEENEMVCSIKEKLQKLTGSISIGKKSDEKVEDAKPPNLSVASKSAKPFDLAEYNKMMKEKQQNEVKPSADSSQLLAKLSGFSGISFASKAGVKTEVTAPEVPKKTDDEKKTDGKGKKS